MNKDLLKEHIAAFAKKVKNDPVRFEKDQQERNDFIAYYRDFSEDRILAMTPEDVSEYISQLWAMLIWGNKRYVVEKILEDNGLEKFRAELADLVWGQTDIADRWQRFRTEIKGMGPAMISEILCKSHPNDCIIWNRRVYVSLQYLQVDKLPRYDNQLTGVVYRHLCEVCREIAEEFADAGLKDTSLFDGRLLPLGRTSGKGQPEQNL